MELKYSKMTGSGNDFIIVDNMSRGLKIGDILPYIPKVCARGVSIGADGFIMLEPADGVDFMWHFYNSDGSVAEMCGNGSRCAARFAYLNGIAGKKMSFRTLAGVITAEIKEAPDVKVQMTAPHGLALDKKAPFGTYSFLNTGVPHAVIFSDDIENVNVHDTGRLVRYHDIFSPAGTNVDFISMTDKNTIRMRTYERGVEGETLACGTGAVASALIAIEKKLVTSPVTVVTSGGKNLLVYKEGGNVYLEGEARMLSTGVLLPESFNY